MSTQDSTANSTSGLSQTADQNASFQHIHTHRKKYKQISQIFFRQNKTIQLKTKRK